MKGRPDPPRRTALRWSALWATLRPLAIGALAAGLAAVAPAGAEVYRCVRPDGSLVFTDDRSACPGAEKHEPAGRMQSIRADDARAAAAPEEPPVPAFERRLEDERAQKAHWQQKKRSKEQELRRLQERRAELSRYLTSCNRGMEIIGRGPTGLKYKVSCDEIRREYQENETLQKPIREYLETGLKRECRQAGCLPGWIR